MVAGRSLKVVAIVASPEAGLALNETCSEMNGDHVDVHVGELRDVHPNVEIFADVDVLLLEVDPRSDEEVAALDKIIRERFPRTPVVATAADANLQDVRQLMRLGVVDVVPQPVTSGDLGTALDFAARSRRGEDEGADDRGKVIALLKAGGGVGATTLAVQAGHLLAQRFKDAEKPQVCIVDFDVQYGDAALFTDLDSRVGLIDLAESPERLDASLLQGVMTRHESGLDILAAPRDLMPFDTLAPKLVADCLRVASQEYRYVIVDLPLAWNPATMKALNGADMIALVLQLTVPNVRKARRQLDALASNGLGDKQIKLVVNRFEKGWGKSVSVKEAVKALGHGVDYCVMNDFRTVSESINQGVPLSRIARRTKVERSIKEMLDGMLRELAGGEVRAEPRLRIGLGR